MHIWDMATLLSGFGLGMIRVGEGIDGWVGVCWVRLLSRLLLLPIISNNRSGSDFASSYKTRLFGRAMWTPRMQIQNWVVYLYSLVVIIMGL